MKRELIFHMHDASQRKTSESFARIKESIVSEIEINFENSNHVAASIEDGNRKVFSEPTLQESTVDPTVNAVNARLHALQNRQQEMKWGKEYDLYLDNIKEFEDIWVKAYVYIWEKYCSREIQFALKEMPDYDSNIKNEPLELLVRIEKLMHTPMKAKYPPLTLIEVLSSFLSLKQGDNEELLDYLSRFKSERNVMKSLFGKGMLDGFVENTPEYISLAIGDTAGEASGRITPGGTS